MIYAMARALETRLKAKGFPVEVYYGPDQRHKEPNRTCIVVERSNVAPDQFGGPQGVRHNPRLEGTRAIAVQVHVFAKASLAGARRSEHEDFADQLVDGVHCALLNWGQAKRMPVSFESGAFAGEQELAGSLYSQWPGVIYTINLRVSRGVRDVDFDGAAAPEASLTGITTTTETN